jgi:hypothetical protein
VQFVTIPKNIPVLKETEIVAGAAKNEDKGSLKVKLQFTCPVQSQKVKIVLADGNKPLFRTLWTPPYSLDLTSAIQSGKNTLSIDVTSTWFNRLVYDAGLPEDQRKTWCLAGPKADVPLRENGLLGPVKLTKHL